MNLYEYGAGNPAINTDPSGEIIPLLVILGIVIVGALIAGAMNAVRQGIRYVETGQGWSWKEFGLATLIGGATAPLFVFAPEVMIPIAMGFGLSSAINEYDAGHYATGTFDLLTSLLPLTSESVRSGSLWTRPGIVSRFQMRWTSMQAAEGQVRSIIPRIRWTEIPRATVEGFLERWEPNSKRPTTGRMNLYSIRGRTALGPEIVIPLRELEYGGQTSKPQSIRIAPFGNRWGGREEWPHYHYGRPVSNPATAVFKNMFEQGQGMGRHRPIESSEFDNSWLDRFF
jgi:hypothetical protein